MAIAVFISYPWLLILLVASTLDYYFIYKHRLLLVFGLAFSRALTNYAIISSLIWYFTYYNGNDLVEPAIWSNIQDSLSSLFVILMAHAADSYVGRFHILLFSNTAYIGGLLLLWLFGPYDVKWLGLTSLVLLALGSSGVILLQHVLEQLVVDIDRPQDETKKTPSYACARVARSCARAGFWLRVADICGAILAILWVAPDAIGGVHSSWRSSFSICILTMTVTSIVFCIGHNVYYESGLIERPLRVFLRVCNVGIKKLLKGTTRCLKDTFLRHGSSPRRHLDAKAREEDMVIVKSLLRMFPMWVMFLVVALISATGSSFFFLQYSNLNTNSDIAVQIYSVLRDFSSFAIPFLYRWICKRKGMPVAISEPSPLPMEASTGTPSDDDSCENEKVKIGAGMLCGIVSCIFAWLLEVQRLKKVNHLVDKDANTSISFLWLVPQFCVLGGMDGLTKEGLLNVYSSHVTDETLKRYGVEYIEIVMFLGKLLSIFFILIFQRLGWFGDTINDSRVDKYYIFLVHLSTANLIIYCCILRFYYKDSGQRQNLGNENLNQDDQTEPQTRPWEIAG